jgi:hypothetical protein
MLKGIIFFVFIFIFISCKQSTDISGFPENGNASVKIDDKEFSGVAFLSSENIADFNFTVINLELDDSTSVKIRCEDFREGIFSCGPTYDVIFSVRLESKSLYSAKEGFLNLKKVNSEQIVGEFGIVLFDATSSCRNCPGTLKESEGKFNAIKM